METAAGIHLLDKRNRGICIVESCAQWSTGELEGLKRNDVTSALFSRDTGEWGEMGNKGADSRAQWDEKWKERSSPVAEPGF